MAARRTQFKTLAIAGLAFVAACGDDPTGPARGTFTANVTGARTLRLEGLSYTQSVYTESRPQGSNTITMGDPVGAETRLVLIDCPGTQFFQVRTYILGTAETGCRGVYRLMAGGSGTATVVEEFVSITGTLQVTAVTATMLLGSFQFTGDLSAEGQANSPVTVSGVFNSVRYP